MTLKKSRTSFFNFFLGKKESEVVAKDLRFPTESERDFQDFESLIGIIYLHLRDHTN